MLKLDLHIHSQYSEDAIGSPEEIIKSLQKKGLQGMAITDHNTVEGGLKALKLLSTLTFDMTLLMWVKGLEGHLNKIYIANSKY